MNLFRLRSFFAVPVAVALLFFFVTTGQAQKPTVLLISIDGFRCDYFGKAPTPNLRRLGSEGVQAKALIPVFPTMTFPSHYSMLTGLHPERHGIVGNSIRDPSISRDFSLKDRPSMENPNWWLGEPIWITAQKQKLLSATCFWPGTDVAIAGMRPTYWLPFDGSLPNEKRILQVIEWLSLPAERQPQFLTLYLGDVDHAGHFYGPESPEVVTAIQDVDRVIGLLIEKLKGIGRQDVNVIIVSDHGMSSISLDRVVVLDQYINVHEIKDSRGGELVFIVPKPGKEDVVMAKLKRVPHARFYRREELPERLHFRDSPRIAPIVGLPDDGWMIFLREFLPEWKKKNLKGMHGFDNAYRSMHGIFIAHGPAFRNRVVVELFLNLHIYELVAKVLQIKPAPNQGELSVVIPILKN